MDWMFTCYQTSWDDQEELLQEWLAADPVAAAISAEEAEEFVAAGYLLRFIDLRYAARFFPAFGVRVLHENEKWRRRAALAVLRKWKDPKCRELLAWSAQHSGFGPKCPDVGSQAHRWNEELFASAYLAGTNIMWLVRIKRHLGLEGDLTAWLQRLDPSAEREYRMWKIVGQLSLSRLVYAPEAVRQTVAQAAAGAQVVLAEELREKDRRSGTLRQHVRRLEQDRKRLKEEARRAELEARSTLSQARGEVAAASRALAEEEARQERERLELIQRSERQLAAVQAEMEAARQALRGTLEAMAAAPRGGVLAGQTVMLLGSREQRELGRLLVASLGGQVVDVGAECVLDASRGLAALERQLMRLGLRRVLIKCDGNFRRKGRRPGLAMSAFQIYVGGEEGFSDRRVTCCGPAASSMMAEYGAVAMALSWLASAGPPAGSEAEVWSDCKFMVRDVLAPEPKHMKRGCVTLRREVLRLLRLLASRGCQVRLRWVPREQVHAVDRLCAQGYWEQSWYHRSRGRVSAPLRSFLGRLHHGAAAT